MIGNSPDRSAPAPKDWLIGLTAIIISTALLWLISRDLAVTGAFALGLPVLGLFIWLARYRHRPPPVPQLAAPDWSVTVAAIETPECAVAITDRAGRLVCANHAYQRAFGLDQAPPLLPVDDAGQAVLAQIARTAWRDGAGTADDIIQSTNRWQASATRAGRGEDHLVWRFVLIRKHDLMADLVPQLDGKVGRALSAAGFSVAVVNPDGLIRAASPGFAERATGDADAEMVGQDFIALIQQDDDDRFYWARDKRFSLPLTLYYLPVADPDDAEPIDPETTPSLLLIADAGTGLGGARDNGAAVPHLEALVGQLPLGLAMADRDGRLLFANLAFMRAAGLSGDAPPTYPTDLVVQEDKAALSDAIRRHGQGPATSGDVAIRLKAQPDEPVSLSLAGVRGLGDAAVLLGLTDSTEETRLKRQVAQATKMQAVGQLAGGVAHDFNNVLTAIIGTCDLMLLRHTPGDSDYDDIQQIRANSNRAASLTRQLLAFSRQQTLRPEVLQLPDIVSDISQMLKRLIGEKIVLEVTHDRDLGPVRADPTQLEQVIVNLAVNARDAMQARGDGGGRLTLTTKRVSAAEVRGMRSEVLPVAAYTALLVADSGGGIAPEHLGKIWEPFFTTKEQGKGTGLGLSTVYGIVKQSGGFIFADSVLGEGTTFSVYLPVHHAQPGDSSPPSLAATPAAQAPAQEWAGGGRILLVEDEAPVRMVAERALARAGYTLITAGDGDEGLEKFETDNAFDLILSDVVMPGMDGPAMVREIRQIAPKIPILFMSGYAEEQLRKEIDIADIHFLPKPFSVQQITEKVAGILSVSKDNLA